MNQGDLLEHGVQAEVRAAIGVKKWGNAHGAKGGRKEKT